MVFRDGRSFGQVRLQIMVRVSHVHGRTTQHVRGSHETRVPDLVAELLHRLKQKQLSINSVHHHFEELVWKIEYRKVGEFAPLRLADANAVEHARELESVFGIIDRKRRRAQHSRLCKITRNTELLKLFFSCV